MSEDFDFAGALAGTLPPMYAAVLETQSRLLKEQPAGVDTQQIGIRAWESLTLAEQQEALPQLLASYVHVVQDQEHDQRLDLEAEDTTHTYLDVADTSMLWDSATCGTDGETSVDRKSLINVLCEVELLTHRLAMRDEIGGA